MNKICTSIEQSKKLIELGIDVNTADMYYMYRHWEIDENTVGAQSDANIGFDSDFYYGADNGKTYHYIPAWSLSALLDILPNNEVTSTTVTRGGWNIEPPKYLDIWFAEYETEKHDNDFSLSANSPIDAAFEMVVWLKENNKI